MKQLPLFFISLLIFQISLANTTIKVGAECTEKYFDLLFGKRVAVVANQSSIIGNAHLVDSLLSAGIVIARIFSPEHGFRGTADAGEAVKAGFDTQTGLEIVSLYGTNYKPKIEKLADVDIVLFDLQDVGARFYTYFSTMCYVMEACAQTNTSFIVLDRPNPNGHFIDGPILEDGYKSFVGKHPVPIVHGMTAAEYARMVNDEGWLTDSIRCQLSWILCDNYDHSSMYELPIKPSPNLPNALSIRWYPTLALYEGINMSIGRGTEFPFQVVGHPNFMVKDFGFTPISVSGAAKNPRFKNENCSGIDLRTTDKFKVENEIQLELLLFTYLNYPNKDDFFIPFFLNLSGTSQLKNAIVAGKSVQQIRDEWHDGLVGFQKIRSKYLLYPDSPIIIEKFGSQ